MGSKGIERNSSSAPSERSYGAQPFSVQFSADLVNYLKEHKSIKSPLKSKKLQKQLFLISRCVDAPVLRKENKYAYVES